MHSGEATAKATPTGQPAGISGNKKVLKGQKGSVLLQELKTLMLLVDQAFMNMRQHDPKSTKQYMSNPHPHR